jgi:exonuclease III
MVNRVHRSIKIIAFNANGILRQRYELSKQLQDIYIDVALFSETHLKPHEMFSIQNYHFYRNDRQPGRKGGIAVAVKKGIPHNHVDLPPLISVEATGDYIPNAIREFLLAAVYKSSGSTWSDADIAELLNLRHKCILAGDLNAKHPSWNNAVSNPSGEKLLQFFYRNDFEISAPQCPTHYSPGRSGDVLDIVVHKNIRRSNVIVSDILDSDHLPIIFHILDHVRTKDVSAPLEKFTDWERFQSLPSNLISPSLEINLGVEADKTARDFTASIASAYRLATSKITLTNLNSDLPGLDRLLKYKKRMRKLAGNQGSRM